MKHMNLCLDFKAVKFCLLILALAVGLSGCGFFGGNRASATGLAAAKSVKKYLGAPYVSGGRSPKGFDCSGLTSYVYDRCGVDLPRSSAKQARVGRPVRKKNLRPGDLVFFKTGWSPRVSHVGIYIGNDKFIHAPGSGKRVTTGSLNSSYFRKTYHSARRVG